MLHELRQDEIRRILEAAADIVFSDGVSVEFLDYWTAATAELLALRPTPVGAPS